MLDLFLFRPVKRFFDFCDSSQPDLTGLPDVILSILQKPDNHITRQHIAGLMDQIDPQWTVILSDLTDEDYDISIDDHILYVNSTGLNDLRLAGSITAMAAVLLSLVEGLRMVRHIEWLDQALNRYHPQAIVEIGRICVSDCVTQAVSVAWFARNAGNPALWKYLLCGKKADMAVCFDRMMMLGRDKGLAHTTCVKEALSLTFRTWFTDPQRIKEADHDTLNLLDSMLAETMAFGHAVIQRPTIACLTLRMGGEGTYLDQAVLRDMMINPFYKDVYDPVNRVHLDQIMRDSNVCEVAGIPFRDPQLAQRFV